MAWERRKRGQQKYYYRSVRRDGVVLKEYIGTGPDAELAAEMDALKRAERQTAHRRVKIEEQRIGQATTPLNELGEKIDTLLQALLMVAGYHYHRGEWRRKRDKPN